MAKSKTTHISLTEAKQRLGELVKRSAYGGERFVIEFRGKPQALVISLGAADDEDQDSRRERGLRALESLRKLRESQDSSVPFDSTQVIREMREERDDDILGLR